MYWDDVSEVVIECEDGAIIRSQRLLCAAGRLANVGDLQLNNVGLMFNDRGLISVDDKLCTVVSNIYAAADLMSC